MLTVFTGTPTICVTVWAVLRLHFHDTGYVPTPLLTSAKALTPHMAYGTGVHIRAEKQGPSGC